MSPEQARVQRHHALLEIVHQLEADPSWAAQVQAEAVGGNEEAKRLWRAMRDAGHLATARKYAPDPRSGDELEQGLWRGEIVEV